MANLKINVHSTAVSSPCLMLHRNNNLKDDPEIPDYYACPVNMRKVDTTKLGKKCVQVKVSLVNILRNEKKGVLSRLNGGIYNLIFTSYVTCGENSKCDVVFHSTLNEDVSCFQATHLTKEIIIQGIRWLRGNECTEIDFGSVGDALKGYFVALNEVIPLQDPYDEVTSCDKYFKGVIDFIKCREWPDDCLQEKEFILKTLEESNEGELSEASYLARRFIYNHVAKQTKIVAHALDGIHRLTALECVLIGYQPPTADDYAVRLPHAETKLAMTAMVPTETELNNTDFINKMKKISSECQQSFGSLHPHRKKEFFAHLIKDLNGAPEFLDWPSPFFLKEDKLVHEKTNLENVIGNFAKVIIRVIREKKHVQFYPMVPGMNLKTLVEEKDEESWTVLFKKKNKYSFLWDEGLLTLVSIIRNYSDVFNKTRYARVGFNAEVFELAQVLIMSRISQDTYNQLFNFFTTNTVSSRVQLSARDMDGLKTDQWVSAMFDTVTTGVYYSYKVVKNKNTSENSDQLLMRLIKSAIKGATQFFNELGLDPSPPSWFEEVPKKLGDPDLIMRAVGEVLESKGAAGKDLNAIINIDPWMYMSNIGNFITFIRVAFAVTLHSCILNKKRAGPPTLQEDLQISPNFPTDGLLVRIFHLEDMDGKVTACIKEWCENFELGTLDDLIVRVMRHFLDSKKYVRFWKPKKENKKMDNQEYDDPFGKLMTNLVSLKQTNYPSYLQEKIRSGYFDNDESDLAQANSLLELFQILETSDEDGTEDDSMDDSSKDGKHIAPYTCEYLQF